VATTLTGPMLKSWYPALAQKLGEKELDELARLLAAVKRDTLEEAAKESRRR
jgi:hypothetical protein